MKSNHTESLKLETLSINRPLHAARIEIPQGAVAHNQSHASETLVIVLEGTWRFSVAESVVTLTKDEALRIPAHECYSAEALTDTIALRIATASRRESQYVAMAHDDPDQYLWGV
jgi:quercetin dioxygenase-like cupin family protein